MITKYRADHVGSLLRPQELLQARSGGRGEYQALRDLEDKQILRVPPVQEGAGSQDIHRRRVPAAQLHERLPFGDCLEQRAFRYSCRGG